MYTKKYCRKNFHCEEKLMNISKYITANSKLKRLEQYFWDFLVNEILSAYVVPLKLRMTIFSIIGIRCRKSVIHGKYYIGSKHLILGENSYINREVLINNENDAYVKIGNNCSIAYRVSFYTTNHIMEDKNKRGGKCFNEDIIIGNGCWIGANSIILPGVTLGDGVVIAAGSVVNKDCDSNCFYSGIPAKKNKLL